MATPVVWVSGFLALSLAANAALVASNLELREKHAEAKGTWEQAAKQSTQAIASCNAGVARIESATARAQAAAASAAAENRAAIQAFQRKATAALSAKPDNPADLCGSLNRWLGQQIMQERAR